MTTLTTEEQTALAASGAAPEPKATTKANVVPRKPPRRAIEGQVGEEGHPSEEGR